MKSAACPSFWDFTCSQGTNQACLSDLLHRLLPHGVYHIFTKKSEPSDAVLELFLFTCILKHKFKIENTLNEMLTDG